MTPEARGRVCLQKETVSGQHCRRLPWKDQLRCQLLWDLMSRFLVIFISSCCCLLTKSCLTFETAGNAAHQASLFFTISWGLLKLMSIELVMPTNQLILYCPLLLPPSIFPSIRVFSNESALPIRWPMYWSFSFSISPYNEYSGLISFRMDWFDLLSVQGTLKSLLQHHRLKASDFFRAQPSLRSNYHIRTWLLEKL